MKIDFIGYLDYLSGYLRYGHFEGEVDIPDEDWEEFIANPQKYVSQHRREIIQNNDLELKADDFSVEDYGDIYEVDWEKSETE